MEHVPGHAPEPILHAVHVCTEQDEAMRSACFCVFVLLECHLLTRLCRWSAEKPSVLTLGLSRVQ